MDLLRQRQTLPHRSVVRTRKTCREQIDARTLIKIPRRLEKHEMQKNTTLTNIVARQIKSALALLCTTNICLNSSGSWLTNQNGKVGQAHSEGAYGQQRARADWRTSRGDWRGNHKREPSPANGLRLTALEINIKTGPAPHRK